MWEIMRCCILLFVLVSRGYAVDENPGVFLRDNASPAEFLPAVPVSTRVPICPEDVKHCPDGHRTMRNPQDHCRYHPCKNQCRVGTALPNRECGGQNRCPNGYYCQKGFLDPITSDAKGWCCPDEVSCSGIITRSDTISRPSRTCDDGSDEARQYMRENQCILPPCPRTCPRGHEPTNSTCPHCGREQYCYHQWCCPSDFFVKLCKYEHHIWKDYRIFNEKHKKLVDLVAPGKPKHRVHLDQLFKIINCINELICKVVDKKKQILDGRFDRGDIPMARCFWRWIDQIWQKAREMESVLNKLRKLLKKNSQRNLIDDMQRLRASCLVMSVENLNTLTFDTGDLIMYRLIPVSLNSTLGTAAYNICRKAEELGLLYHRLLSRYIKIYGFSILLFKEHDIFEHIPANWFNEKIKCIHDFATLYYEIRECCGNIAQNKTTLNKVVKKIGAWLKKAMDLREKLRKCFPPNSAVELTDVAKAKQVPEQKVAQLAEFVIDHFKDLLKQFDDCIIKMRCIFIDTIVNYWIP